MAIPASAQTQADRANELIGRLNNPEEANPDHDTAALSGEADGESARTDEIEKQKPEAVAPQPVEDKRKDEPQTQKDEDALYWRHRFDVLQGKYNAEVPTLRAKVTEIERELAQAKQSVDSATATDRLKEAALDLTPEELEDVSPELVDIMKRVYASMAKAEQPTNQDDETKARLDRIEQERLQDKEAKFYASLDQRVEGWRDIDVDPAFHKWLDTIDPATHEKRGDALRRAGSTLDAYTAVNVFKEYKALSAAPAEPKSEIPQDQVQAPSGGRSTETTDSGSQKIWTGETIKQFYEGKRRGEYTPEKAQAIEADILAATSQGRVRR